MRERFQKRTGLFLMEIIINIAFFALISTICVRYFVDSRMQARQNKETSEIQLILDNISNVAMTAEGNLETMAQLLPGSQIGEEKYLYYIEEPYYIKTTLSMEDKQMIKIDSEVYKNGWEDAITDQTTLYHIPYQEEKGGDTP